MVKTSAYKKTKLLMENYKRLQVGIEWCNDETSNMLARINKCLSAIQEERTVKNTPDKYEAFKLYYLGNITQEQVSEKLYTTERTVRRWINELNGIMSVYLFGVEAIVDENKDDSVCDIANTVGK